MPEFISGYDYRDLGEHVTNELYRNSSHFSETSDVDLIDGMNNFYSYDGSSHDAH